ncbi:unnamed protein product [Agarophyton chilense]
MPKLPIVLIDAQSTLRISSVPITVTQLAVDVGVQTDESHMWCENRNIRFLQERAVSLKPGLIVTEHGFSQPYSVCCIATGASPFIPGPLRASEFQNIILTLRDDHSVQHLANALSGSRAILVVGAGGIAMELVHEITNCHVIWLVRNHIGGSFFDERAANALSSLFDIQKPVRSDALKDDDNIEDAGCQRTNPKRINVRSISTAPATAAAVGPQWLRLRDSPIHYGKAGVVQKVQAPIAFLHGACEKQIKILEGCEVMQLRKDVKQEWPVMVELSNGDLVGCDRIVVTTGVTANVDWLSDSSIELASFQDGRDGGIVVEAGLLESSVSCVFAAGDCASVRPTGDSDWFQLRLWSQALVHGRVAAQNMAGRLGFGESYAGLEYDVFAHSTKFFGKRVILLGRYNAQGLGRGYREYERCGEDYLRVVVKDGRVRGAILVGDVDGAEVFENLILTQLNIDWLGERIVDKETDLDEFFD